MFDWGEPAFTTSYFNAENMEQILGHFWSKVETIELKGELAIPVEPFLQYFSSNIGVWNIQPTEQEKKIILDQVRIWINEDLEGKYIVEPKKVAISICKE